MTWREAEKLLKKLLPRLPADCTVNKRLLFLRPINHIVRGFYLDRSTEPSVFYLEVFAQPLYLAQNTFVFSIGKRLGNFGWRYEADREEVLLGKLFQAVTGELPVLRTLATPAQFAENVDQFSDSNSVHLMRARAYSLVLAGEYAEAIEFLDQLHAKIISLDDDRAWVLEKLREAEELRHMLVRSPAEAEAKLYEWERYTLANLRLEKFATGH